MKILVIGAGGTGGILSFLLAKGGKDVTVAARGKHLQKIQENGLTRHTKWDDSFESVPISAMTTEEIGFSPDILFLCVKSYSLPALVPVLKRISGPNTLIVPLLNGYNIGGRLQEQLPQTTVLDGCIYISANIESPGVILQHAPILRVVYGRRDHEVTEQLQKLQKELDVPGVEAAMSTQIQRDTLKKFCYVSPVGAAGMYWNGTAGDFQKKGEPRDFVSGLMREVTALADAMGYPFDTDMVQENLAILDTLPPDTTTSMQRDILAGHESEWDELVLEPIRLGEKFGVATPFYRKVQEGHNS